MALDVPSFVPKHLLKVPGSIIWLRAKPQTNSRTKWVRVGENPERVIMTSELIPGEPSRRQVVMLCGRPAEVELQATIVQLADSSAPVWTEWQVRGSPVWLKPEDFQRSQPVPILDPFHWAVAACGCPGESCRNTSPACSTPAHRGVNSATFPHFFSRRFPHESQR